MIGDNLAWPSDPPDDQEPRDWGEGEDEPRPTTESRLLEVLEACREQPTQTPRPRFSNALSCLRAHVYDAQLVKLGKWPASVDRPFRWNFAAMVGTALGGIIEKAAQGFGAITQAKAHLGGSFLAINVTGDADIDWPDLDAVHDLKWVGDYAWKEAKKGPDPKHVAQVNGYAVARGRSKWALIYFPLASLGKGEGVDYVIHEGRADADQAKREITDRWAAVAAHVEAGTLPDREVEESTCRCLRCQHLETCSP